MIDWKRVRELYDEIGEEAFEEVLSLFVEEVDEALVRLQAAQTPATRMAEFHFLKGAALNLGLQEMATCCGQAEAAANDGMPTDTDREIVLSDFPTAIALLRDGWRAQL
ncbi:Hpt domain-containing protein [Roseinatronobacter sp. NSM]|uniref:Hpt domain-containing protein n=1 Tax=Roseinatronobacter sp. NSM TaxID=3457785 RepID=UPI0040374167